MKAKRKCGTNQGGLGKIFFDVPIYRLTKGEYESSQSEFVERNLAEGGTIVEAAYRKYPEHRERMANHLREVYGGCWEFNEIIGFIRLYFFHTQIRGEYWRVDTKKITKTRKKIFKFLDYNITFEEEIPEDSSNAEIYAIIMKYLERAQAQPKMAKHCIDTSVFEFIGPHINWTELKSVATRLPSKQAD